MSDKVNWSDCTYKVDQLFILSCPGEEGLWVADAKSLLANSNCIDNCGENFDIGPSIELLGFANYLNPSDIVFIRAHEFAFTALLSSEIMNLNYIDMLAALEENFEQQTIIWENEAIFDETSFDIEEIEEIFQNPFLSDDLFKDENGEEDDKIKDDGVANNYEDDKEGLVGNVDNEDDEGDEDNDDEEDIEA